MTTAVPSGEWPRIQPSRVSYVPREPDRRAGEGPRVAAALETLGRPAAYDRNHGHRDCRARRDAPGCGRFRRRAGAAEIPREDRGDAPRARAVTPRASFR